MEHWQFLIQKQGDRSWHILESPNLEILEGQYRVLARSNLCNTDVEVRVTHSSNQKVPPKRRIFKRSRRTDSEGLMVVIPFTYLKPGVWQLRCSGDLMSDLLGKSWQYSIQLEVLFQNETEEVGEAGGAGEVGEQYSVENQAMPVYVETLDNAITVPAELAIATESSPSSTGLPDENKEEDTVIDQPVSPVWLKGETAEHILQNLIELALPASEVLRSDEKVTDFLATQPPPPLLLTLERENYIASWGQALTINGHIELKEKTNLDQSETLSPTSLCGLELGIELRSPLESKILTQIRQPVPDQVLPFNISTSIDIPAECESKLILADITLYGGLADVGEVMQLASQSFIITADVTELLAITAKPSPSSSEASTEPEIPVSLDLKLFNLIKIPKTDQSQTLNPSPNKRLTPQILRETTLRISKVKNSAISPQLPKLPPVQIDASVATDNTPTVDAESSTQEELLEKDATISVINLEQLVIRQRRTPILNTIFPYLKRLKALPGDTEEVKNDTPDILEFETNEDFPQLDAIVAEDKNTFELNPPELVGNAQSQDESVAQLIQLSTQSQDESVAELAQSSTQSQDESVAELAQSSTEFITKGNLYSSPLLRKWMQSQGYSLPESINELQLQNYDNYISTQQMPLSVSAETQSLDVNLPFNLDADRETWKEADTAKQEDIETQEDTEVENILENSTLLLSPHPLSQIPLPPPGKTSSAWLAQEIVVDDTYSELEDDAVKSYPSKREEQPPSDLSHSLPITAAAIKPLPIPQLDVPDGELIGGKSLRVRVVLPEVLPQVVIKLWVEDYQTRWLLDGPHLLTNLLPNSLGGAEVMTQLNIPLGCLEIRLEAIALNAITQQESHKVTIVRAVIPPDLPALQLDELLGM